MLLAGAAGCSGDSSLFGDRSRGPTLVPDRPRPVGEGATVTNTVNRAGPAPMPPQAAPPPVSTTEPRTAWTLLAGGDVLMDRSEPAGIDPFEFIRPPLASADLAIVNAEMAISDRGSPSDKQYVFRAPPSVAATMAAAGVTVASLANNHASDYGSTALVDSIESLKAAGVVPIGAGIDADAAYRHRLVEVSDAVSVALVGASMIVPWGFEATAGRPGIASTWNTARVLDSVRAAAGEADVVVAVIHWGIERDPCPSADQRSLARALIGAGADIVIGHHPHVLQPVELTAGALVAYSLGNFVWHPRSGITGETGVLQVDFDGDAVVAWTFHPHLLDDNGAPRPAAEGARLDRIRAIIAGDCDRHRPPPTTTPTPAEPDGDTSPESEPDETPEPESPEPESPESKPDETPEPEPESPEPEPARDEALEPESPEPAPESPEPKPDPAP